ncbi:MAG: helix-turn-helix transcriptional regulator [Maritimibacter sp.]|nr:helix-turn-helix transcriptional regulator [Maritimibacter sp.]
MIDESGFDGVTMAGLARRVGVSTGTLYLYVRTKEELFLALFVEAMASVTARVEAEATRDTLVDVMTRATVEEPLYLALLARLAAAIEANVADEPLFAAKRRLWGYGARTAAKIAELYGIEIEMAGEIAQALMIAMQGAAHFDITSQRDPSTVPEDMRPLYASQAYTERFPTTARLILASLA